MLRRQPASHDAQVLHPGAIATMIMSDTGTDGRLHRRRRGYSIPIPEANIDGPTDGRMLQLVQTEPNDGRTFALELGLISAMNAAGPHHLIN